MALGCFRRISCYCHVGGALHRNCTLGWQGGQCLFQVRLYTWKMRELCPGVLPLPGQYAICRSSLRDNWLWDYMGSQAGSQAGRQGKPALPLLVSSHGDSFGSRRISPCSELLSWRQKREKRLL